MLFQYADLALLFFRHCTSSLDINCTSILPTLCQVLLAREERTGRREEGEVYDEVDDKGSSSRHNQNGSEGEDFTY